MFNIFFTNFAIYIIFLSIGWKNLLAQGIQKGGDSLILDDISGYLKFNESGNQTNDSKTAYFEFKVDVFNDLVNYQMNSSTLLLNNCKLNFTQEAKDESANVTRNISFKIPNGELLKCLNPEYVPILNVSKCGNNSNHNLSIALFIPPIENSSLPGLTKEFILQTTINRCNNNTLVSSLIVKRDPNFLNYQGFNCLNKNYGKECKYLEKGIELNDIKGMICARSCEKENQRASLNYTTMDLISTLFKNPHGESINLFRIYGRIGESNYFREIDFDKKNLQEPSPGKLVINIPARNAMVLLGNTLSLYYIFEKAPGLNFQIYKVPNIRVSHMTFDDILNEISDDESLMPTSSYGKGRYKLSTYYDMKFYLEVLACILMGLVVGAILIGAIYCIYILRRSNKEIYDIEQQIENSENTDDTAPKEPEEKVDENMDLSFLEENNTSQDEQNISSANTVGAVERKKKGLEKVIDDFDEESEMLRET